MASAAPTQVPNEQRDLIVNLFISDNETGGQPALKPEDVAPAREWLVRVLLEYDCLLAHIDLLQELYRAKFRYPRPRWDRAWGEPPPPADPNTPFRHHQLLPGTKARTVGEKGPDVLDDNGVAALLLNPFALCELAEVIHEVDGDFWCERMDKLGRELMEREGLEIPIPGEDEPPPEPWWRARQKPALADLRRGQAGVNEQPGGYLVLTFEDDAARALARRIAEHFYGDPDRAFSLKLIKLPVPGNPGQVQAELEVWPAPTKNDLEFRIAFPIGAERTFTLEVPPGGKNAPPDRQREKAGSGPCDPLPAAALKVKSGEWRDDAWPPMLVLR